MSQSKDNLESLAIEFDSQDPAPEDRLREGSVGRVMQEIFFHDKARYWQFTPTTAHACQFADRLYDWVTNEGLSDHERITLLRAVPNLQFVDRDDLLALYRAAYDGPISRWLIDELDISFSSSPDELSNSLDAATRSTWYCPMTDSMNIAQFHHINGISGKDHRPCWRTLRSFGDPAKIRKYMKKNGLSRLVILDDFVGSGTQSKGPLKYAAEQFGNEMSILFVPLVISAFGLNTLRAFLEPQKSIRIEPVFIVPEHAHIRETQQEGEPPLFSPLRSVIAQTWDRVKVSPSPLRKPLVQCFGFEGTGGLIVLYTNCPNNTVPLFWHKSPNWLPLFPRISRD